jgi:hypothetical protein
MTTTPLTKGTRIKLVHTDDPYTKMQPGEQGTVRRASAEYVEVDWDCGSKLAMLPYDGDRFEVID